MDDHIGSFDQSLRGMQIITVALAAGALMFVATVMMVHLNAPQPMLAGQGIALFLAVFGAALFVVHLLVPAVLTPQLLQRRQAMPPDDCSTESGLLNAYRMIHITSLGPLEGAAFANAIAWLLQRQWWSLAIVAAIVLWMLAQFPTRTRVRHWIESQHMQRG